MKYFGEDPKTSPPSMFFPVFVRFIKAFKVRGSTEPDGCKVLLLSPVSVCPDRKRSRTTNTSRPLTVHLKSQEVRFVSKISESTPETDPRVQLVFCRFRFC